MTSSKQQKKDKIDNNDDEGKKYNCQCGESFSSVEEWNEYNHNYPNLYFSSLNTFSVYIISITIVN